MKLMISGAHLRELTEQVLPIVARKATLPILSHLHLSTNATGELQAQSTDLETTLTASVLAEAGDDHPGTCCADAHKLASIAKRLEPGDSVRLALEGERLIVRAGRSRWTLGTLPAADWPQPTFGEAQARAELAAEPLRTALAAVHGAMARNDVRYYLNGVLLEIDPDGAARVIATDGHRLHHAPLNGPLSALAEAEPERGEVRQVILPAQVVDAMLRLLSATDTAQLAIGTRSVRLERDGLSLHAKLVDGRYPDWRRVAVARRSKDGRALVARQALLDSLERVLVNANSTYKGVALTFEASTLSLRTRGEDQQEADDSLELTDHTEANHARPLTIGLNGEYVRAALKALTSEVVQIDYQDLESPLLIHHPDTDTEAAPGVECTLMPMRL